MNPIASLMIAAAALIIQMLGCVHLFYTFYGTKLHPRDATLIARMKDVAPVLTHQTTMWKAWIGFNASHSLGAILFGLIYAYLALAQPVFLLHSPYLLGVGLVWLLTLVVIGKRYWFSIPYRGVCVSTLLYLAGIAVALT